MRTRIGLSSLVLFGAVLFVASVSAEQVPARAHALLQEQQVVTQTITSGARGTDLGEGEADARFTWNYSGRFEDPRYLSYTAADGGRGLWVGKHELANCIMAQGRCWSNTEYGPDVAPGTPSYQGVEYFFYTFDLPAEARDVELEIESLGADDRLVLLLNDELIGGFTGRVPMTTEGIMQDAEGQVSAQTFYSIKNGPYLLDDPALFRPEALNVLTFWVNNTGSRNLNASARPHGFNDISRMGITAELRYSVAVRTPASTPSTPTPTVAPPTPTDLVPTDVTPTDTVPTETTDLIYLPILNLYHCLKRDIPVDAVLVIDASTSMRTMTERGRPRIEAAQEGAAQFVSLLREVDHVAVVAFNEEARLVQGLSGERARVGQAIAAIETRPYTRIDLGLEAAGAELASPRARPEARKVVVLLTDGQPTRTTAQAVRDAGRRLQALADVFVIGVGADIARPLMVDVAGAEDRYYPADDAEALREIYTQIAQRTDCDRP